MSKTLCIFFKACLHSLADLKPAPCGRRPYNEIIPVWATRRLRLGLLSEVPQLVCDTVRTRTQAPFSSPSPFFGVWTHGTLEGPLSYCKCAWHQVGPAGEEANALPMPPFPLGTWQWFYRSKPLITPMCSLSLPIYWRKRQKGQGRSSMNNFESEKSPSF